MNLSRDARTFLVLTFLLTWILAGAGATLGIRADSGYSYMALAAICMLMPALAAILLRKRLGSDAWQHMGVRWRGMSGWMLVVTAVVGMSIVPLSIGVCHVLGDGLGIEAFGHASLATDRMLTNVEALLVEGGSSASPEAALGVLRSVSGGTVLLVSLVGALLMACSLSLPVMLGEELGWRGFLFHCLSHWSTRARVLFTGIVWGLWHAPLILMGHNYPDHRIAGVGLMVVFCVLLSYLFDRSRAWVGSIWGPCVLHGIINGSAGVFVLFAAGGHPLVATPTGVAGFIAIALLAGGIALLERFAPRGSKDERPMAQL